MTQELTKQRKSNPMAIKEFEVGKYYLLKNPGFPNSWMSQMVGTVRKCRVEDGEGGFEPNAETPVNQRGDRGLFWWSPDTVDHAPLEVGKYYRLQAWQERIERPSGTHFGPWDLQSSGVRKICGNVMRCLRVDNDGDGCFAGGWCWPYEHVFLVDAPNTISNPPEDTTADEPAYVGPSGNLIVGAAAIAEKPPEEIKPTPEMKQFAEEAGLPMERLPEWAQDMMREPVKPSHVDKPTLPFSPTYRRFCWHKWVSGPGVVKEVAWLPLSIALLGLPTLFAVSATKCLPPVPFLILAVGVPVAVVLAGAYSSKTVADRICTKCGRSKLDFQLMLSRRATAERKRQAKHQAKAEKAAAEKELNEAALAKLNTYIELARKARD